MKQAYATSILFDTRYAVGSESAERRQRVRLSEEA